MTGGGDGQVFCARLDGREPVLLARHEPLALIDAGVKHLALTSDGRVVTGGADGRVYCARLEGGEPVLLARHEPLLQNDGGVMQLALTSDGRVVTGGADGRVSCAQLDGGEPVLLAQHESGVAYLALTDDGRIVQGAQMARRTCVQLQGSELVHSCSTSMVGWTASADRRRARRDRRRWPGVLRAAGWRGAGNARAARRTGDTAGPDWRRRRCDWRLDGRVYGARLEGGVPLLLTQHEGPVNQLAVIGDGCVVTGGKDGRVFSARLHGGGAEPIGGARESRGTAGADQRWAPRCR